MTASDLVRPANLVALALAAIALVGDPVGGGVAHAKVWAAHTSHTTPNAPVRARTAVQHAVIVTPRAMPSGPVRAHNMMLASYASPKVSFAPRAHAIAPAHLVAMAPRGSMTGRAPSRAGEARWLRTPRLGTLGPLRAHSTVRPPVSPTTGRTLVRWPVGAGAHPVDPSTIPPSQREAWIRGHAGRR
jgi:hypothetical protein